MTDERAPTRGYYTYDRIEKSKQAFIYCLRCCRAFPVNVDHVNGELVLQPGRVVYDDRLGFLCPDCSAIIYKDDEQPETGELSAQDIRQMIVELLTRTPDGMTVKQIAAALDIGRGRSAYYLYTLLQQDVVTRTVQRGQEDIYRLAPAPTTTLDDILKIEK
ncbi:MAG: hypothetical protein JW807_16655 [Spirochaetes bacterium]|nr:hypothetical protein [Spirochaetota bacterium]